MKTENLIVGNLIRSPHHSNEVELIIKIDKPALNSTDNRTYFTTIPIDTNRTTIGRWDKNHEREEQCYDCDAHIGYPQSDCKTCKGKGTYSKTVLGMESAELLASNVKEYIMDRVLKNFEFKH